MNRWVVQSLIPPMGVWFIRGLGKTMRWSVKGSAQVDRLYGEGKRMIIAFWHGQQLMMPLAYRGNGAHILISQHRDGELIYRIVRQFGFEAVRGSTTRGGSLALRQLIRLGRSGADLIVTPDGPRGPRHVVQRGIIHLAQATGLPIIPLSFACSKKKSCRVGINSSFPSRFLKGVLFGENRCGSNGRLMTELWKGNVKNWKPFSVRCWNTRQRWFVKSRRTLVRPLPRLLQNVVPSL